MPLKINNTLFSKNKNRTFVQIRKNFSIGLLGSVFFFVFALGRTAVLTKGLPVEDYGRILVVINFYGFLMLFFGLRVNDFLYRFYPQFNSQNAKTELKGIFHLSFLISLLVGISISLSTYILATWISTKFYNDLSYAPLLEIYAISAFFLSFEGFYSSILRLNNRFILIVLPQVIGIATSFVLIAYKLIFDNPLTLKFSVTAITAGTLITTVPPLLFSLLLAFSKFGKVKTSGLKSLKRYRKSIISTLFQTNLTGLLKLSSDTGGIFLLGILSSPSQVALYGLAKQLAKGFQIIQNNIQNAFTPEIVSLFSSKKYSELYRLIKSFSRTSFIAGGIIIVLIFMLSKPIFLTIASTDYLEALPTFYILIFTLYLTFISLPYFPLALSMDKLGRRNLVVSIRILYLSIFVCMGLNAIALSIVQLISILTVRIFNDLPLLQKLRSLSSKD